MYLFLDIPSPIWEIGISISRFRSCLSAYISTDCAITWKCQRWWRYQLFTAYTEVNHDVIVMYLHLNIPSPIFYVAMLICKFRPCLSACISADCVIMWQCQWWCLYNLFISYTEVNQIFSFSRVKTWEKVWKPSKSEKV